MEERWRRASAAWGPLMLAALMSSTLAQTTPTPPRNIRVGFVCPFTAWWKTDPVAAFLSAVAEVNAESVEYLGSSTLQVEPYFVETPHDPFRVGLQRGVVNLLSYPTFTTAADVDIVVLGGSNTDALTAAPLIEFSEGAAIGVSASTVHLSNKVSVYCVLFAQEESGEVCAVVEWVLLLRGCRYPGLSYVRKRSTVVAVLRSLYGSTLLLLTCQFRLLFPRSLIIPPLIPALKPASFESHRTLRVGMSSPSALPFNAYLSCSSETGTVRAEEKLGCTIFLRSLVQLLSIPFADAVSDFQQSEPGRCGPRKVDSPDAFIFAMEANRHLGREHA